MGVKKIVVITTGQPATNPRAVKDAVALENVGYKITFIYNFWAAWALPFDEEIMKENPTITWQMAGSNPINKKAIYYFSRIRHKYFRSLNKIFPSNFSIARNAALRGFSSLVKTAASIKADLYIAHNLGALPAAALAAKKYHAKYAFDAEDFHRGQEVPGSIEEKRTILIEDTYLPGALFITAASPLIAEKYSGYYNSTVTVINNVFSKKYLVKEINETSKPIKLFWFSQTIGKGRGLEDIIHALMEMPHGSFSLTLLGKHDEAIKDYFIELEKGEKSNVDINFLQPVSPAEIFAIAAQHDVGLALEQSGELNRNLCLTNKIFTYLLAGNAIIFSDTKAQKQFYEDNTDIGSIYECGNSQGLKNILYQYSNNRKLVLDKRKRSLALAGSKFNWEMESFKLIEIIKTQ